MTNISDARIERAARHVEIAIFRHVESDAVVSQITWAETCALARAALTADAPEIASAVQQAKVEGLREAAKKLVKMADDSERSASNFEGQHRDRKFVAMHALRIGSEAILALQPETAAKREEG